MISNTKLEYRGNRTIFTETKHGNSWTSSTTSQSGLLTSSKVLSVSNGTGGTPGRRLPTSYSFWNRRTDYGSGYESNFGPTSRVQSSGAIFGTSMMPSISKIEPNAMWNEIYNRALDSLQLSWRGDLDLSVDGLQSRQTIKMVRNVLKLSNYVRSFSPKRWSEKWLEYQYGWKPTVSTIYGLAKEAITPPRDGPAYYVARSNGTHHTFKTANSAGIVDSVGCRRSDRCEIKVCLTLRPTVLNQLARISSLNPASIAWELLPYSFVVDWMFDIGSYLRSMESALIGQMVFNHGYVTRSYRIDRQYSRSGSKNLGPSTIYSVNGSYREIETYKIRNALSSYPRPLRPSFNVSMGSSRVLSAAALLDQHFSKKR